MENIEAIRSAVNDLVSASNSELRLLSKVGSQAIDGSSISGFFDPRMSSKVDRYEADRDELKKEVTRQRDAAARVDHLLAISGMPSNDKEVVINAANRFSIAFNDAVKSMPSKGMDAKLHHARIKEDFSMKIKRSQEALEALKDLLIRLNLFQ